MPTPDVIVTQPANAHAVLVAGPGTGKTRKIEARVEALLEAGVQARDMALLTLTRETRRTLHQRISKVRANTMHAYVLARLNELGDASGKRMADEWETENLLSLDLQLVARLRGVKIDLRAVKRFLRRLGTGFRQSQLDDTTLTHEERQMREAFMQVRNFLVLRTFDELAHDCIQLLASGHRLQYPPKALVIDEYQDLTAAELKLIELVSQQADAGVFACGDDRQAIYGFREADPLSLNNFGRVYDVEPAFMSVSHRCPRAVVALSEALADRMPPTPGLTGRPPLVPEPGRRDDGQVRVLSFTAMWPECDWISRQIDDIYRPDDHDSVMVIAPFGIKTYVEYLNEAATRAHRNIRFVDSRRPLPFQAEPAYRLWLALLRIVTDDNDHLAWRALLHLARGYGAGTIEPLFSAGSSTLRAALRARAPVDAKVRRLVDDVVRFTGELLDAADSDAVIAILARASAHWGVPAPADLWAQIQAAPADEETTDEAPDDLAWKVVLTRCRRAAGGDISDVPRARDEVLVYTIYQAKGQQADHIFICGAHADAFRDQDVSRSDGLRRLYVAVTRAIKTLTISIARDVRGTPLQSQLSGAPSFPDELLESCRQLALAVEADPA